jgi:hypothetical protein
MSIRLIALLASMIGLVPSGVEQDGVRIEVSITARVYVWTVTNLDAPPIRSFEIEAFHTYNPRAPTGWEVINENDRFLAWTDDERRAVHRGESASFDARVSPGGAVLGTALAFVGFGPAEDALVFKEVWGPVREPPLMIVLVAAIIAGIGAVHGWLLARGDRHRTAASASAPADPPAAGNDP